MKAETRTTHSTQLLGGRSCNGKAPQQLSHTLCTVYLVLRNSCMHRARGRGVRVHENTSKPYRSYSMQIQTSTRQRISSRVYGGSGAPPKICARTFPKSQNRKSPKSQNRKIANRRNLKIAKSQIAEIANRRNRKSPKSQISKIANRKSTKSQVYLCDRKPRLFCHLGEYTV